MDRRGPWAVFCDSSPHLPWGWPWLCVQALVLWEEGKRKKVAQSCLTLATPWTVAHQAVLSMGFSRQEYWSGLPFPSPRGLPSPGIEPRSPALQADALPSEPPGKLMWEVGRRETSYSR